VLVMQRLRKKNTTSVKEKEPGSEYSPEKGVLTKLPGDICGHCKGRLHICAETGKKGQALCGVCVRDGINGDHYNYLTSSTCY